MTHAPDSEHGRYVARLLSQLSGEVPILAEPSPRRPGESRQEWRRRCREEARSSSPVVAPDDRQMFEVPR